MLMMAPLLFSHTSRIPSPNCVFSPSRQIPKQAKGKQRDLPIPYVSIAKTDRQLPELGGCVCVAVCVCVRVCVSVCVCVCVCQEASERTRRPTYKLHLQLARTLRLDVNRRAVHNQLDVNGRAVHNQLDVNGRAVHNQLDVNGRAVYNQLDVNGRAVHNQFDVNGRAVHNQLDVNERALHNQFDVNGRAVHINLM